MIKALIDADLVAFMSAASAEAEDDALQALMRADRLIQQILSSTEAHDHSLYLTGRNNFRKKLDPEYKAHRKAAPLPKWLADVRGFLVTHWKAVVTNGYEADDALGMEQDQTGATTILCSLDKDLLQIPGQHFNWKKGIIQYVTPDQGLLHFYTQSLIGDRADNITGVRGIGPVKAAKLLSGLLPSEYYATCRDQYKDDERYHRNLQLLWVWRELNGTFKIPSSPEIGA